MPRSKRSLELSRRQFLTLAGVAGAAGATGMGRSIAGPANEAATPAIGPGAVPVKLEVNGKTLPLEVQPRVTLVDALRDRLGLTGTKKVCDHGACGACTVLLDGKPVYACMVLAVQAQGKRITTVEGLAKGDQLDPVQAAFVAEDALMCGFCTPGFVMSARAVCDAHAHPTEDQVRAGLSGNLCRCGTYSRIQAAMGRLTGGGK